MTTNDTARANGSGKGYRVGVIGHTGRGNYGHSLDLAFQGLPGVEYAAVADADSTGREACAARTGAPRSYADYREMVERERPDLVSICPTFLDEHADMVRACAAARVRGIFLEKPMAGTLTDCDAIVEACAKAGIKLAVGHGRRFDPWIHRMRALVASGRIGKLHTIAAHGKGDRRGGTEDFMVLGSHLLDLLRLFAGDVEWAWGRITRDGHDLLPADVIEGAIGMGASGGDGVVAHYAFRGGIAGTFESRKNLGQDSLLFGLTLYGTDGILSYRCALDESVYCYPKPWSAPGDDAEWEHLASSVIALPGDAPRTCERSDLTRNQKQAVDLIAALEEGREPYAHGGDARASVEMIAAAAESHRTGLRVSFPLANRENPFERLRRGDTAPVEARRERLSV